jgi:hypothetical protein
MISALLLPLVIDVASVPVATPQDDPPIRLWINNDRRFLPGDRAKVEVRTRDDGYLMVFHVDPEGHLRILFPLDPDRDNFVRGGKKYEVRGRGGRESFEVDNTSGKGTVYAAVSRDAFRVDGFVVGDHWDYRALAPSRLSNDPEQELNDLLRRMAQGDFDYDLLNYYVNDRVAYRSDYSRSYGSYYNDDWCYRFSCSSYYGSPFSLSIVFGRPYRRYYYDPYFYAYDPFYNPFFYDPYYYGAVYRPRYAYPYSRYYVYDRYQHDRYYYDRYRSYRQPYTPYRFRGADGSTTGYRDRFGPTRWVNTVYNPPISPAREPGVAKPGRRLTSPVTTPSGSTVRPPEMIDAPRGERRTVEARRSPSSDFQDNARRTADGGQKEPRLVRREVTPDVPDQKAEPRAQRAPTERPKVERSKVREERRDIQRPTAREARPAREPQQAPRPEARPEPRQAPRPAARPESRQVERPSPPPQSRGSAPSQPSNGDRRRR